MTEKNSEFTYFLNQWKIRFLNSKSKILDIKTHNILSRKKIKFLSALIDVKLKRKLQKPIHRFCLLVPESVVIVPILIYKKKKFTMMVEQQRVDDGIAAIEFAAGAIHKNESIKDAAQKGYLKALYQLGSMYQEGAHVKKDADVAIKYLTKASEDGDSNSMYLLGNLYLFDKGDFIKAQNYLRDAYKKDHIDATYLLGELYFKNNFVKADYKISIKYLSIADKVGHPEATYLLGLYYTEGLEKQSKDVNKGLKLLKKASDKGSVDAKYELAKLYLDDTFEKKDSNLGKQWLKKLADDGHSKAQFMLSKIYFQETDFEFGYKWAEVAIKSNHHEAQLYLGKKILSDCEIDPQGLNYVLSFFSGSKIYCNKGID